MSAPLVGQAEAGIVSGVVPAKAGTHTPLHIGATRDAAFFPDDHEHNESLVSRGPR
jgi:hypothetical protein